MKLLLDTHIFLWYISDDKRLLTSHRDAISDFDNQVYLSVVSLWEIIIKYQLGKLSLPESPDSYVPRQRDQHSIQSLSVDETSVAQLEKLPALHRDPFDRLLICQAQRYDLEIVTVDSFMKSYPVQIFG